MMIGNVHKRTLREKKPYIKTGRKEVVTPQTVRNGNTWLMETLCV